MDCAKLICQECATTWEGINYCAPCLAHTRGEQRATSSVGAWLAVAGVTALLLWVASYVMMWVAILFVEAS